MIPKTISAYDLITPKRFDIAAKHAYARLREVSPMLQWGRHVYEKHILALNQAFEREPKKLRISDFFSAFDTVLESIRTHGFDDFLSTIPLIKMVIWLMEHIARQRADFMAKIRQYLSLTFPLVTTSHGLFFRSEGSRMMCSTTW